MRPWRRVWMSTPLRCINNNHRELRRGGAGGHVARVLLMAGRVDDDEPAPPGGEKTVSDADGDALLALGLRSPSTSRAKSRFSPCVPYLFESRSSAAA